MRKVEHFSALPYTETAAFMTALRGQNAVSARALEFLILTATRTSEVVGARWSEVSLAESVWTIPGGRMKAGREFRVPLSPQALSVLREMNQVRLNAYMFPGRKPGCSLSNMALLSLLQRMGRTDITSHGFRSTFRDWSAEQTNFPRDVAEAALAHTLENKVEAAYRRGDLFDKRRKLMEAWGRYCGAPAIHGAVLPLRGAQLAPSQNGSENMVRARRAVSAHP